jgi:hypothetical protein
MSTIKVDNLDTRTGTGNITLNRPLVGDGSGLTNLPSQTANDFTNTLKTKLDNVEASATADQTKTDIEALGIELPAANLTGTIHADRYTDTVYTHPTTAGNKHIPSGGATDQVLTYSSSGTAAWATPAGGAWEYVSTSSGNATSRSFRNIFSWSTYPCWMFVFNGIAMDNAGGGLGVQFYDASDALSTSGYQWNYAVLNSNSSSWSISNSNSDTFMHLSNNPSNAAPLWCNLLVWYGGTRNMVTADCIWDHTHAGNYFGRSVAGGRKGGFESTGIYFKQWAGVFQGGDIYAYRLKKS